MKRNKKYYLIGTIIFLIIAGIIIKAKWKDFGFDQTATINIILPEDSAKIFIDDINVISIHTAKGSLATFTVGTGFHSVLLAKDNYWPWQKQLTLEKNQTVTLQPFLLSKNLSGVLIPASDNEYGKFISLTRSEPLPTANNKKISSDGKIAIWIETNTGDNSTSNVQGNTLMSAWLGSPDSIPDFMCLDDGTCPNLTKVFTSQSAIKNVDFYGSRDDVMLFSSGNGVYVIETDKKGIQNFQPLYQGNDPYFFKDKDNSLYIKDGANLMQVKL